MNSKMSFGEEFTNLHTGYLQFSDSWIPGTPQKPTPVSGPGNQFGRGNWPEFDETPPGYFQELLNNTIAAQNFNTVEQMGLTEGDYLNGINLSENRMINNSADYCTRSTGLNNDIHTNFLATRNDFANRAASKSSGDNMPFPNLHPQPDNWRLSSLHNPMNAYQTQSADLQLLRDNNLVQFSPYGCLLRSNPTYNSHLPSRIEVAAVSRINTTFQSMQATPNHIKKMEDKQLFEVPTCAADESSVHGKEKQETLIAPTDNVPQQNRELLQNIVDSSSAVISATIQEKKDIERSDQGIDLNKTPQQKPPKRRKHRPKVIVEGKPKRTPNSATTRNINSNDKPSGKRKYVRRKGLTEPVTENTDFAKESDPSMRTPAKRKNLKESTHEQLDSMKTSDSNARITEAEEYVSDRNQSELTEQAGHTMGSISNAGTVGKRKYVRKTSPKASATQHTDCTRETDPIVVPALKSCRRALNFNLEITGNGNQAEMLSQREILEGSKSYESHAIRLQNVENSGSKLTTQIRQQSGLASENQQSLDENSQIPFLNKMMTMDYIPIPTPASQFQIKDNLIGIPNVRGWNINMKIADLSQHSYKNRHTQRQQTAQFISQGKSNWEIINQTNPERCPVLSNHCEDRGSKRDLCHAIEHRQYSRTSSVSSLLSPEVFPTDEGFRYDSIYGAAFQHALKRKRIEDETRAYVYDLKHTMPHVSGQLQTKGTNSVNARQSTSLRDFGTFNTHFQCDKIGGRKSDGTGLAGDSYVHSTAASLTFLREPISPQLHSGMEMIGKTNGLTVIHKINIDTNENCNHLPPTTPEKAPISQFGLLGKSSRADVSEKKKREHGPSRQYPSGRGKMLQEQKRLHDYQQSTKARGPSMIEAYSSLIEGTINKFKSLTLDEKNSKANAEEQNALVTYKGAGTIVPYEEYGSIKKRKPRPKVDLDSETNRVWNLLMGKEGDDIEGTDKEKEKWWEKERTVFRGRVDSFIARMHLVQGDRRFSKWKGSVVDSVIGVFLTQNVSDHLSSSAFMSLAARFPLKSSSMKDCDANREDILIDEPEVGGPNPNETISHPLDSQSSMTPTGSTNYCRNSGDSSIERRNFTDTYCQSLEEEVLSSQGSFDSLVIQANGGIRSYSGSNSETEDPTTGCKFSNIHGSTLDQIENSASFEDLCNYASGNSLFYEGSKYQESEVTEDQQKSKLEQKQNLKQASSFNHSKSQQVQVQTFGVRNHLLHMTFESEAHQKELPAPFNEECSSSWASTAPGFSRSKQLGQNISKFMVQHNGLPISQDMDTRALTTSSSENIVHQQEVFQQGSYTKRNQLYNFHQEKRNESLQSERTSVTMLSAIHTVTRIHKSTSSSATNALKAKGPDDDERISALNKNKAIEHSEVQSNAKESMFSSEKEHGENDILKPKRRKPQVEINNATNWDGLRKQVEANGSKTERSEDTKDSLDYEAMRNAHVSKISDVIKERGMSNMLAERMKEFLNRLVRDHGSIDLEWLREVPPDKAKDYLLSIRGLGLKSVECVRLLTLHHLAFPVDTNVGRIAVRLGWVPLQPLPESLQLHLLELYPMLESIQKFLWPRLCKLDQRTLYELHYQMITFGKVFCTKTKPNCNACPMRAECRHFASAFASARLALPGPEGKSITGPTVPMMPVSVVNQMPLPLPEHLLKAGPNNGNHEPIIEEPATPEPEHTEESLSDIEDACYEDPDEIPTIKLDIKEFTSTLQHFMQAKTELPEGDLSKALVALTPEVTSIPTPKLKNVSRLRTEHYVYELPDKHPLLEKMDRREPDDPSPYLLAIWTPGETANSIQLPEQSCRSQEPGRLCNEKTCFACNNVREANAQTVRGTILIPCRTAMRGSFPLNGTYFQVNEVFAEHESSLNPINVPREWIWNLPRRTVYFGTSVSNIFKGLSTEGIQYCFWKGFVCVRGFDQKSQAPRPLTARLHFPASKLAKTKTENKG